MEKHNVCKSCHWGWALVAGMTAGLSAGLFLQSKKGKELTAEGKQAAHQLQKELMKKWKQAEHFTQKEYSATVKKIVAQYKKTKGLAVDEAGELQEFLLGQWEAMQDKLLK